MKKIPWKWLAIISAIVLSTLAFLIIKFPRQGEDGEDLTWIG